jgi:hypothetical protein
MALRAEPAEAVRNDNGALVVLAAYHDGVVYAYDLALREAGLTPRERTRLAALRDEAKQAAAVVRNVIRRNGGTPPPQIPAGAPAPPELGAHPSHAALLGFILANEERTIGGWYLAVQALAGLDAIRGAGALMAACGRRVVAVRVLAGREPLQRAFETGGA